MARSRAIQPLEGETALFLGSPALWETCQIRLLDVQALFGGRNLVLRGDGQLEVERVGRGQLEKRQFSRQVGSLASEVLLLACQVDLVGAAEPLHRSPVPDEARPSLTLVNSAGEERTRSCWMNGMKHFPAFGAVYRALLDLDVNNSSGEVEIR